MAVGPNQRTGIAATIAIIAGVGGIILACAGHPLWGLIANLVAIGLGAVGLVMAASPRVSGGIMSIVAIALGGIGIVLSILAMVGVIVF